MENWKPIKDFEGLYEVSNLGRVKSAERSVPKSDGRTRKVNGGIIKPRKDAKGYLVVNLWNCGKSKTKKIHRLVAGAFLKNTKCKPQVNHINGVKTDNRLENLEWTTARENTFHSWEKGLQRPQKGEAVNFSKLNNTQVLEIRKIAKSGKFSQNEIAEMFGVAQQTVSYIICRKSWKHI